jgi:serine/threonine protein phosphatase PrpC
MQSFEQSFAEKKNLIEAHPALLGVSPEQLHILDIDEETGDDISDLLDSLTIGDGVALMQKNTCVATITLAANPQSSIESEMALFLIRPSSFKEGDTTDSSNLYVEQGISSLTPDPLHQIGGYFRRNTYCEIGQRTIPLPAQPSDQDDDGTVVELSRPSVRILASSVCPETFEMLDLKGTFGSISGFSDIGKRDKNQDAVAALTDQDPESFQRELLAVIDGFDEDGHIVARQVLNKLAGRSNSIESLGETLLDLSHSLSLAGNGLNRDSGAACAFATVFTDNGTPHVCFDSLGDCRALLCTPSENGYAVTFKGRRHNMLNDILNAGVSLEQLNSSIEESLKTKESCGQILSRYAPTLDDEIAASLSNIVRYRASRQYSSADIIRNLDNIVTRSVHALPRSSRDSFRATTDRSSPIPLDDGSIIILMSDGLDLISDQEILSLCKAQDSSAIRDELHRRVQSLIDKGKESDNFSAMVYHITTAPNLST